jgi:hypothetical protein
MGLPCHRARRRRVFPARRAHQRGWLWLGLRFTAGVGKRSRRLQWNPSRCLVRNISLGTFVSLKVSESLVLSASRNPADSPAILGVAPGYRNRPESGRVTGTKRNRGSGWHRGSGWQPRPAGYIRRFAITVAEPIAIRRSRQQYAASTRYWGLTRARGVSRGAEK